MRRRVAAAAFAAALLSPAGVPAAERTVTLTVDNMTCVTCPYIVREALSRVDGVSKAQVSLAQRTAIVTFDDDETALADLTAATTRSGFPSRVRE